MSTNRSAGKRGANPRSHGVVIPRLENHVDAELLASLPAASGIVDRESRVGSWPIYLNNQIGDCTCAGMGHAVAQWTAFSGSTPGGAMFADQVIQEMYSAVSGYDPTTGANDNGAELYQVCDYMMKTGITDVNGKLHKIAGYADIAGFNNLGYLKQVLNAFGTVYLGVNVGNQDEVNFSDGKPWTLPVNGKQVGADNVDHCIVMSYSGFSVPGVYDSETIITWGAEQKMNVPWAWTNIGEAIAIVSEDWMEANGDTLLGQSMAQLIAELKSVPESGINPSDA
jgi:hypothetical protein